VGGGVVWGGGGLVGPRKVGPSPLGKTKGKKCLKVATKRKETLPQGGGGRSLRKKGRRGTTLFFSIWPKEVHSFEKKGGDKKKKKKKGWGLVCRGDSLDLEGKKKRLQFKGNTGRERGFGG